MSCDPLITTAAEGSQNATTADATKASCERRDSLSQRSEDSQTAADFIRDQMQLEADAREALPYSIENCTKQLGPLRQNVFACLTCNPPPANSTDTYNPAGVCYSCSVQCHGEHDLVEIFQKRNFTCDCGTTRFKHDQPCTLRVNTQTNTKGDVHSEAADPNNKYNQNFSNHFCSCSIDYKPQEQKGTMFQCLGLGTHETGCGEDWYHPGCLVGMGPKWYEKMSGKKPANAMSDGVLPSIAEDTTQQDDADDVVISADADEGDDNDAPLPDGFPGEEDFDHFICYKCVEAYPWIKRYAGTTGFLPAVFFQKEQPTIKEAAAQDDATSPKKRKLDDEESAGAVSNQPKRIKSEQPESLKTTTSALDQIPAQVKEEMKDNVPLARESACKLNSLPPAPQDQFSLFMTPGFRDQFCRCDACFPDLKPHPQLLEEEEAYEPPLSDSASDHGSTHGSGSLYERGESALRNVDRVRAIEGVMAYNHLKDKLKPFFQQFAESGKAISAQDINDYFAKLRGDQEAIKEAGDAAKDGDDGDNRREQSGY
ncbi:putative metaphase-anaphase transition protein [Pseudomassariella vexata]|uniref:Putative metaphase-anaphase transition protein n=1 Tax=Pseudomassariella vexata TaxID=1141098 RepID=A0A1Y2DB08_9PEZI|nr:putative metaphase-anaphase transition protein [Pseudomassariella vexata]ORY56334.1 putative metaphase-anaphase transition protein [Pseudomassariella vexata]